MLLIMALLAVGFLAGMVTEKQNHSRALEGCEVVAGAVSDELTDCRWNYSDCQTRLIEQLDRNRSMIQLFLPNHMERE